MDADTGTASITISVVAPVKDEEEALPVFVARLCTVLDTVEGDGEVILVDDGSTDRSYELMSALARLDNRIKVIRLSRCFGHQLAITAGLDMAEGDATVVMDSDLQDPPEVIPALIEQWRNGFDIVHARRVSREGEPRLRAARASLFYRLLRRAADVDIPVDVGDFRLIDRQALLAFRSMPERNRYIRGMFAWVGFRQTTVEFVRSPRLSGASKYTLPKLMALAADGLFSFSNAPLRAALRLGFIMSGLSFLFALFAVGARLAGMYSVPGIASVVVLTTFLGGLQLTLVGVLGEYVARIYDEVKRRPLYLVTEMQGFPGVRPQELDLRPASRRVAPESESSAPSPRVD
jgi:dolichol-phosphate mannosyltransferase